MLKRTPEYGQLSSNTLRWQSCYRRVHTLLLSVNVLWSHCFVENTSVLLALEKLSVVPLAALMKIDNPQETAERMVEIVNQVRDEEERLMLCRFPQKIPPYYSFVRVLCPPIFILRNAGINDLFLKLWYNRGNA